MYRLAYGPVHMRLAGWPHGRTSGVQGQGYKYPVVLKGSAYRGYMYQGGIYLFQEYTK